MQLFYQSNLLNDSTFILNEEESIHIARVLRLKAGDVIHITNGFGALFTAELLEVHHKKCVIAILQKKNFEKSSLFSLHLAVAPTKNIDRMEWFVEKAVELGIDEITPIICTRSERKEIKIERLIKVAVAAMKQSLKYHLPKINESISFKKFITERGSENGYLCYGEASLNQNLHQYNTGNFHNLFLIGPEGDFTSEEIYEAIEKGFKPLCLGASRLRTETAALHVVSVVNFKNNTA